MAGLRDFPSAGQIICRASAWQSVRHTHGLAALAKGFLPGLLPPDIEQRLHFVDAVTGSVSAPLVSFGSGYDLFGDGSAPSSTFLATQPVRLASAGLSPVPLFLTLLSPTTPCRRDASATCHHRAAWVIPVTIAPPSPNSML